MIDEAPAEIPPSAVSSSGRRLWPTLIFALLGLHIAGVAAMVYVATRDRSFAVEPDYYQKALHWDQEVEQQRAGARLGWKVELSVDATPSITGERAVTCRVTDRSGRPVDAAVVEMVAFAHARASRRSEIVLLASEPGVYRAPLRLPTRGLWEFRLVVSRGRDTLTHVEQLRV